MKEVYQILLAFMTLICWSCNGYYSERTTQSGREDFRDNIRHDIILNAKNTSFDSLNLDEVLWAIYMFNQKEGTSVQVLERIASQYESLSNNTRYNFWLAMIVCKSDVQDSLAKSLFLLEENPKTIALAAGFFDRDSAFVSAKISNIYACQANNLKQQQANYDTTLFSNTHFQELLNSQLFKGKRHVFSFHSANRDYQGLAFIVDSNGQILTNDKNEMITYRQLARSAANVPFYLTNGNSPCGLYSIQGTSVSENVFIGPVPTLQIRMPFESEPTEFYHKKTDGEWTLDMYLEKIPERVRELEQLKQSFISGQCGRSEIILHGSTIDPEFYREENFYPLTPSLGCITSYEKWSDKGKLIESDQNRIIQAYKSTEGEDGYFVLVNLINENRNVLITDLQNFNIN